MGEVASFNSEAFDRSFVDPDCPLVANLIAADASLEEIRSKGLMDEMTYLVRRSLLDSRAVIVRETQKAHGCPQMNASPTDPLSYERANSCSLPTGLVENWVLGTHDQMVLGAKTSLNKGIGF